MVKTIYIDHINDGISVIFGTALIQGFLGTNRGQFSASLMFQTLHPWQRSHHDPWQNEQHYEVKDGRGLRQTLQLRTQTRLEGGPSPEIMIINCLCSSWNCPGSRTVFRWYLDMGLRGSSWITITGSSVAEGAAPSGGWEGHFRGVRDHDHLVLLHLHGGRGWGGLHRGHHCTLCNAQGVRSSLHRE